MEEICLNYHALHHVGRKADETFVFAELSQPIIIGPPKLKTTRCRKPNLETNL